MLFIMLPLCFSCIHGAYVISLYGDVYKDHEFFTRTYPWIIDNIGGEVSVDYFLQGSGRYTIPQMCVLQELRWNTFLQAQYLKCEAEGRPSKYCLCETGIDPQKFKVCVSTKGSMASTAAAKFTQVGLDHTPLIELGPKITVFGVEDTWFLKKICTIFGDNLPRGCVKPFACNHTERFYDKKPLAQFDVDCEECYMVPTTAQMYEYVTSTTKGPEQRTELSDIV